tara:strand:+ start:428 stop:637 length:210 start_codon:yes stop_codon:yes gene_type:complete
MLLADFALPSLVLGPELYPPCTLHRIDPFLQTIPGALQGLFPCFVKVSQGSLNFIAVNYCLKKKREKKY